MVRSRRRRNNVAGSRSHEGRKLRRGREVQPLIFSWIFRPGLSQIPAEALQPAMTLLGLPLVGALLAPNASDAALVAVLIAICLLLRHYSERCPGLAKNIPCCTLSIKNLWETQCGNCYEQVRGHIREFSRIFLNIRFPSRASLKPNFSCFSNPQMKRMDFIHVNK
jgi:hypothetical protein